MGKVSLNKEFLTSVLFPAAGISTVVGLIYTLGSAYENPGNKELNLIINNDTVRYVDSNEGGVAWRWNDIITELPAFSLTETIEDSDLRLVSSQGEEFSGKIEFSYSYIYNLNDNRNTAHLNAYQTLYNQFGINDDWYNSNSVRTNNSDVNSFIISLVKSTLRDKISNVKSEDFYAQVETIRYDVLDTVNSELQDLGLPLEMQTIDLDGMKISPFAEQRISQRVLDNTVGFNENVVTELSEDPVSPADFIPDILKFFDQMRAKGYDDDAIAELYCLTLADDASREGRALNTNCLRARSTPPVQLKP